MEILSDIFNIENQFRPLRKEGIFPFYKLDLDDLLLLFFNSFELANFFLTANNTDKISSCLELIENISLKKINLDTDTNENLKKGVIAALLWFFDFKFKTPIYSIKAVYQEDIEKGNNITIVVDKKEFIKNPWVCFLTYLFGEKIRETINASSYKVNSELKDQAWVYLVSNFDTNSIDVFNNLFDIFYILINSIKINIIDTDNNSMIPYLLYHAIYLILYKNHKVYNILKKCKYLNINLEYLYDLCNLVNKSIILKNNVLVNINIPLINVFNLSNMTCIYINENDNYQHYNSKHAFIINKNTIDTIVFLNERSKFDSKETLKLTILDENVEPKEAFNCILPAIFKNQFDKTINVEVHHFLCKKCGKVDIFEYCSECNLNKSLLYYCTNCNDIRKDTSCEVCGSTTLSAYVEQINYLRLLKKFSNKILGYDETEKLIPHYKDIHLIEYPLKTLVRLKHSIDINEVALAEIKCKAIPCKIVIDDSQEIELNYNEILLPSSLKQNIEKINDYLKEEMELLIGSAKRLFKNLLNILLISNSEGLIFYPVIVKGYIDTEYAIISPELYNKLFNEYAATNDISLYFLNDILINYSPLIDNNIFNIKFIILNDQINNKVSSYKDKFAIRLKVRAPITTDTIMQVFPLKSLVSIITSEVNVKVTCKRCGESYPFITLNARCFRCKNKISYELKNDVLKKHLLKLEEKNNYTAERLFKKMKIIYSALYNEKEFYEKLDKYFNKE